MSIRGNLLLDKRGITGVGSVEDVIDFLERALLGLRDEEPDDESLDGAPAGENDVQLPLDRVQSDWVCELVDQHGGGERHVGEGHALGTHLKGEDFDRVQCLEGRNTECEDGIEQEDEADKGFARGIRVGLVIDGYRSNGSNPEKG